MLTQAQVREHRLRNPHPRARTQPNPKPGSSTSASASASTASTGRPLPPSPSPAVRGLTIINSNNVKPNVKGNVGAGGLPRYENGNGYGYGSGYGYGYRQHHLELNGDSSMISTITSTSTTTGSFGSPFTFTSTDIDTNTSTSSTSTTETYTKPLAVRGASHSQSQSHSRTQSLSLPPEKLGSNPAPLIRKTSRGARPHAAKVLFPFPLPAVRQGGSESGNGDEDEVEDGAKDGEQEDQGNRRGRVDIRAVWERGTTVGLGLGLGLGSGLGEDRREVQYRQRQLLPSRKKLDEDGDVSSDHPSLPNRSRSQLDARGLPIFTKTYQNDHHHRRHSSLDPHLDPTSFSRSSTSTGYSGDMPPPPPPPSAAYQQSRGSTVRSIRAQAIRRGLDLDSSLGNMSIALSSVSSGRSGYISRTGSSLNGSCKNSAVRRSTIDPRSLDLDSTSGCSSASRSGSARSNDKTPNGLADPLSLDSTFCPEFESTPRSQYEARVGNHRRQGSTFTPSARSSVSEQDRSRPAFGYSTPAMAIIPEEVGPRSPLMKRPVQKGKGSPARVKLYQPSLRSSRAVAE